MSLWIGLAALAAQASPAPAAAPRWEPLAEEGGLAMAIDPASLVRDGTRVRFTLRGTTERPQPDGSTSATMNLEVDCSARTGALHGGRSFAPDGRLIQETRLAPEQRPTSPLRPASLLDRSIFQRVCGAALPPEPAGTAQ